ncbi:DUF488 domain-containing protein [Aquicoccus sp. G2-2]|uniref:DUF488 domain-containing protein n=1 Tax=Aquicoccus sp. G2-2 TaxID=3092120 RepID=UPI002ADF6172|nr:DUF488 domain-containing protein [Aquicoccus sp. G2-2]MEA1113500.1 DUF488 domain-containing protein [Aquicoccus sp. G2-2]
MSAARIHIARVYDDLDGVEGARLLVDRIWPRGIRKEALGHDDWLKDIAPSTELRKRFGHDPDKWQDFRARYRAELDDNPDAVERCLKWCRKGSVTLLYGAKDEAHNQAVVLRDYLRDKLG